MGGWHRPVAALSLGRPLALPVQPRRAAGSMTPIHDHLAWGLVGLYQGNQDEEFYDPGDGSIELTRRRPLAPGRLLRAAAAGRRRPSRPRRRPRRRPSRSTCSRATPAASSATPSTTAPAPRALPLRLRERRSAHRLSLSRRRGETCAALRRSRPAAAVHCASVCACARVSGRSSFHFQFVAVHRAGAVHPRLAAEPEQVLRGDDHELVLDGEHVLQQRPVLALPGRRSGGELRLVSRPQRCHQPASVSESWVEV